MAHGQDRTTKGDRPETTKDKDDRKMRSNADSTGQERGAMADTPTEMGVGPDAANTADPKPFPTDRNRSGGGRKFETD
jgi:hypothetical protein